MEWRICPSWPDYEVSEWGEIRRVVVSRGGFVGRRKPYVTVNGYLYIKMWNWPLKKACPVHQLVAEAFIGPAPFEGAHVAHRDGTRINNFWNNLRWSTRSENEQDKVEHGRSNRGERQGRSKLKAEQVVAIRERLARGQCPETIGGDYGVAATTVKSIKQGRSWAWL